MKCQVIDKIEDITIERDDNDIINVEITNYNMREDEFSSEKNLKDNNDNLSFNYVDIIYSTYTISS